MKLVITSNITKVSARYKRMARNLPGVVDAALRELVEQEAIPLYKNTVATWTAQPQFQAVKTVRGYSVNVNPDEPWKWVNQGTRVRRAIMSRDWRSKTKPNVISSFNGAGRVVFISRKITRPGIEARNFTNIISKRVQARAANKVREKLRETSYGAGMGL